MSSIKDLFKRKKVDKVLAGTTLDKVGRGIESPDYVKSNVKDKKRFIPHIDFSSPSNFAIYGSAEKYYSDSVGYIINQYPYDGSKNEKIQWSLSGTYLDRHVFENEYPRTNGYVNFGLEYGTTSAGSGDNLSASSKSEYIRFDGGPHPYNNTDIPSGSLASLFDKSNIYNTASSGISNLEINGDTGFGAEFWFKKNGWFPAESPRQVFVDIWNSSSANPGLFRISALSGTSEFTADIISGSVSNTITLGSGLEPYLGGTSNTWNHWAFMFANTGSNLVAKLYQNGKLIDRDTSGNSISKITGSMVGNIGATTYYADGSTFGEGFGKLSGSLDEFRFWKRERTYAQIGLNWFTNIDGGGNTDITLAATASTKYSYEHPVDLGVYYKFNEGIINTTASNSTDASVLDYSGRITNGSWIGYSAGARSTDSAIVESNAATTEFKDPIIRSTNPLVSDYLTERKEIGKWHDAQNNSSLYESLPKWITQDDQNVASGQLRNLTQIIASYFDTLQLQISALPKIKNKENISGSDKPYPFVDRFLDSSGFVTSEIFSKATELEYLANRNDVQNFTLKLNETKNIIYQNIYNVLIYLYKTKGTDKAFRNLIRCFGVGEELVKINLYGDNAHYKLRDNVDYTVIKKRYVDFHHPQRFDATVVQATQSDNSNSRDVISDGGYSYSAPWGHTYEAEVIFPKNLPYGDAWFSDNFQTASIFGCHQAVEGNPGWVAAGSDAWAFQVEAIRKDIRTNDAYFRLTASAGRLSADIFPLLSTSLFKDVYSNTKWNFAVRITPNDYPWTGSVSGTTGDAKIEFIGYNYELDYLINSFSVSGTLSASNSPDWTTLTTYPQRFYLGAHRTNWTGSLLEQSNIKASSFRVWWNSLSNQELITHAQDPMNFGVAHPYQHSDGYFSNLDSSGNPLPFGRNLMAPPSAETLILNWDFATLTSSNATGQFTVADVSSGSAALREASRYGNFSTYAEYQHTGLGYGFQTNSTASIDRRYIQAAKRTLPEVINSSDMVSIIGESEDKLFTRESRPIQYFFSFEKSMANVISEEMIKMFATIVDFNNLIGDPVNRYRQEYKQMQKFRELYFNRVENSPDFEKFVVFFKWIDSSISVMLQQLVPGSSKFSEALRNMIESHILERNKYWNKFPTLEMKASDPEAGLHGISEMLYSWKRGHAPIPNSLTGTNCNWWLERTNRDNVNITSGDSTVDAQRNTIRLANDYRSGSGPTLAVSRDSTDTKTTYEGQTYAIRNFTKPYKLSSKEMHNLRGGSNTARIKNVQYAHTELPFGTTTQLKVSASSVDSKIDCNDVIDPSSKYKLSFKLTNNPSSYKSGQGSLLAPFSLYSSSVTNGYIADVTTNFRANTDLTDYHNDVYGDDREIPAQGPFTEKYVGGWVHRHVPFPNTDCPATGSLDDGLRSNPQCRPEAWNLTLASNVLTLSPRTAHQARSTILREPLAKRPVNIRNIKQATGSTIIGNYSHNYEVVQTSGRRLNNRFFVKNEGFKPTSIDSTWIDGLVDYALPRYDLIGATKSIIVERFNAPGGPEVSSRGSMDINAEEYSVYNELNQRNSIVRNALQSWQTDHCGQFGITSIFGTAEGYRQPSRENYNTLANYHKINRNAKQSVNIKSGYDREVEFVNLKNASLSNYNRTLTGHGFAIVGSARSNQEINRFGYYEVELTDAAAGNWAMGITQTDPQITICSAPRSFWEYSWWFASGKLYPFEGNNNPGGIYITTGVAVGDKLRILKNGSQVIFQYKKVTDNNFSDYYVSTIAATGTFYPRAVFCGASSFTNPRISNPRYDNWFVQHPIPQSALQYAWINDSYNHTKDQPLGYVSDFSVPSGSSSTTASAVQFISSSCFRGSVVDFCDVPVNFAQYFFNVTSSDFASEYMYTITSSTNTLSPGPYFMQTVEGKYINTHFNNINGPYGYPSWKQIRTGETPVARYHKRNNILSVATPPQSVPLPNPSGSGPAKYFNVRPNRSINFVEPAVSFKYKPLVSFCEVTPETWLKAGASSTTIAIKNTYGNNISKFSQCGGGRQNIAQVMQIPVDKKDPQMYDKFKPIELIKSTHYREIVYPREVNTGLQKIRGRNQYAEVASGNLTSVISNQVTYFSDDPQFYTFFAQSLDSTSSVGTNGIDRGPLYRRTFWRDSETSRNRTTLPAFSSSFNWYYLTSSHYNVPGTASAIDWALEPGDGVYDSVTGITHTITASWFPMGNLLNSQGYRDGCSTSVYGLGRTPIVWDFSWYLRNQQSTDGLPASYNLYQTYLQNPGWFFSGSFMAGGDQTQNHWTSSFGESYDQCRHFSGLGLFPDRGELNSANYQTIAGYAGTAVSSSYFDSEGDPGRMRGFEAGYKCTWYPTASAYYYHLPWFNTMFLEGAQWFTSASDGGIGGDPCCSWPAGLTASCGDRITCDDYAAIGVYGMRWRTMELATLDKWGKQKKPWFDSYEEYAEDIRGIGKKYTVIPEFKISEHMPYYGDSVNPDFLKRNDKFLSLPGADITSSAIEHTQSFGRGFTKEFFNDYSNTDFQKYFGKFQNDYAGQTEKQEIVLTCRGIKKLLPYNGFYPHNRTLQLASMFSQSLGPYISGLSWSAGKPTAIGSEYSGALAIQSALQPYFAPGILYNTIKSGLAVDWAAYTGSAVEASSLLGSGSYINDAANYRIPFESILDPLGEQGIPRQSYNQISSNDSQNMHLLYPTYQTGSNSAQLGRSQLNWALSVLTQSIQQARVYSYENSRKPYVSISDDDRNSAIGDKNYSLYQMAMSNFLAEIPNFFLRGDDFGNHLSTFVSKEEKDVKLIKGETYYMDVVLSKGKELIMWEDYFNTGSTTISLDGGGSRTVIGKGIDGHSFGPPVQAGVPKYWISGSNVPLAPAFAPYTPPYYYGDSRARIIYTAVSSSFKWDDFFSNVEVQYSNPKLDQTFQVLTGTTFAASPAPASASMMTLDSSLNLFGLATVKKISQDSEGQILTAYDSGDTLKNRWVIGTKMETPVLNFSNTPREYGYSRGMWGGYGDIGGADDDIPIADTLTLRLAPSFLGGNKPSGYRGNEHNLLMQAFDKQYSTNKRIGEIEPNGKTISEAIVAIPYVLERPTEEGMAFVTEKQIMNRYFFSLRYLHGFWDAYKIYAEIRKSMKKSGFAIDQDLANKWKGIFDGRFPELGNEPRPIASTSISDMIDKMDRYIIPPELDFGNFYDQSSGKFTKKQIEPFAMYLFEFDHLLTKEDLADIWQGLMPSISTTADLQIKEIRHRRYPIIEFFSDRKLPNEIRWMVFKVKKKANNNYYKMTADTIDDQNFAANPFTIGNKGLAYSYNWPYDYFSLVELAELGTGVWFKE